MVDQELSAALATRKFWAQFRFEAVVDWIEIECVLTAPSNAQTLRRRLDVPFVEPLDKSDGGAARRFRFRIHDPGCWSDVLLIVEQLPPLAQTPVVTGVEVAFDAYGKAVTDEVMVACAVYMRRCDTRPASDNVRFGGRWQGDVKGASTVTALIAGFSSGRTLNIGNRGAQRSQRIYIKQTDNGAVPLPVCRHRVRFENTFVGSGLEESNLPVTLDGWRHVRFEQLSRFYRFRESTERGDSVASLVAQRMLQIGERRKRNRREGGVRLYARATAASPLNEIARDKLRGLTRRWSSYSVSSTCEISG